MKWLTKNIGLMLFCLFILVITVRGLPGNPDGILLNSKKWIEDGPFELSPERGRFALTYSLVEDKSLSFSLSMARFALPDLGYINGKYVSLFAPGVSFITVPGYLIGKYFGITQVSTFFVISIFAVLNVVFVRKLARYFGANNIAATISSIGFLFATPSFAYAVNLYQHHISTFLLLVGIYLLFRGKGFIKYLLIWFLFGLGILIDFPNFFLGLPIIIYSIFDAISLKADKSNLRVKIDIWKYFGILGIIMPLIIFFGYNARAYGSSLQLAGTVENVREINSKGLPVKVNDNLVDDKDRSGSGSSDTQKAMTFFKTRNLVNGLYIHLISPDRGIIYFAPITLFGILGLLEMTKKKKQVSLILSIIGVNLILYSMWGDPWGGWAFGSRYLIPSYALIAVFVGVAVTKFKKNAVFMIMITATLFYSISVNTLGAITTSANPPKIEAEYLSSKYLKVEKYSYDKNLDFLIEKGSKSYIYDEYLKNWLDPVEFYLLLEMILLSVTSAALFYLYVFNYESEVELVLKTQGPVKNINIYLGVVDKLKSLPRGMKFW